MPLVLEDEARNGPGGGGFDLQTAQTLFWRPVPVLLRQAEREDQFEELTFRILTGVARNNHNMRVGAAMQHPSCHALLVCTHGARMQVSQQSSSQGTHRTPCVLMPYSCLLLQILRVHISSDSDLYFLHSLEVSEEDFQSLKNEQGILVDFASFPGKIITLLDKCISPQPTDAPRWGWACAACAQLKLMVQHASLPAISSYITPLNGGSCLLWMANAGSRQC